MTAIKRLDGFGCNDSCINYREVEGNTYCESTRSFQSCENGLVYFIYESLPLCDGCPLGRI